MNKCLVTTLKAQTNNEALSKYNVLTIKTKASTSPTTDTQYFIVGANATDSISINSPSVGLYKSGLSGALVPYPITLQNNEMINSNFENKDGIIEITNKYNISIILIGSNGIVRMKEIYGLPSTIFNINISNIEEDEVDVAKLKNALNKGITSIGLPMSKNYINKLNKDALYEFTNLEIFNDGAYVLFEGGLGLNDLANKTSLKVINSYLIKSGNLSSLAKLTNLTEFVFGQDKHKGDIMDFINPWIQAGRTSGKIKTQYINAQENITLNGSSISLPSGVVNGIYYLNWTSNGTVTFTAS